MDQPASTLSGLIAQLSAILSEHGDLQVRILNEVMAGQTPYVTLEHLNPVAQKQLFAHWRLSAMEDKVVIIS